MARKDSIRSRGIKKHINAWCKSKDLDVNFDDFERWILLGDEFGEHVPTQKLIRKFQTTRPTMEKWIIIYNETNRHKLKV